jgi:WxL domain surface cell wall-binding
MRATTRLAVVGCTAVAGILTVLSAPSALADTVPGTATLTGGSLAYVPPTAVAFTATLNGANQDVTAAQALDIRDNTGTGAGWDVTLTSTTFTAGSDTLPDTSVTDLSAAGACNAGVTCTLADNSTAVYPVSIPAGTTAPTAVRIQAAAIGTGLSAQTWTHAMNLRVPSNARAGTYNSTWTYSLVSGP